MEAEARRNMGEAMSKALEAAIEAMRACGLGTDAEDARAIILAFLDAAAGDEETRIAVTAASSGAEFRGKSPGAAAILALKEAANG